MRHTDKKRCPSGHPYNKANTYVTPSGWRGCRECRRAHARAWKSRNRPRMQAYNKAWQTAHPGYFAETSARWREEHPEELRAYRMATQAETTARMTRWRKANPARAKMLDHRRRSRELDAFIEDVDPRIIYERDGGRCQLCGRKVTFKEKHLDHIIPLSKGGTHEPKNVQIAHKICNLRKSAKLPELLATA